jgi:POTRA domain, FtsQ-type
MRDNRRTSRRGRAKPGWYIGGAVLAVTLGGTIEQRWPSFTQYAVRHPYFTLQEMIVRSDGQASNTEVWAWSGLTLGVNLWAIDPAQVEKRLRQHSWIRSAQVRREFPQRMHMSVSLRRPVAIVRHAPSLYLDDAGICFTGPAGREEADLPYISGLDGGTLDTAEGRTVLTTVPLLLSQVRLWQEPLSEVLWDARQGYSLFLARRRVTIRLGWENSLEKFAQVGMVLATWPADSPAVVLDARFADQIVLRPYADEQGLSDQDPPRRPL